MSEYFSSGRPPEEGPGPIYDGDRAFVFFKVFLMIWLPLLRWGKLEAIARNSGLPVGQIVQGVLCCFGVMYLLEAFLLTGVWHGKRWAFVTIIVLTAIGIAIPNGASQQANLPPDPSDGITVVIGLVNFAFTLGYAILRLAGTGPKPT